ncbi:uncharacterized protein B0P05DRAFT_592847 [Gilbertella persicaria]|uniref:uncharacterized protein n=1 Tax=Gilbertella persicaria TaxID=101096 RepID=UPI00221F5B9C|nr:uncharacterized protein B0P05DRAFT_592847 [Gilbertella persicaria]KAI8047083.1 hypothetical protein B0P05DRAFT_592847 [Gilbertella persicaria]
MTEKKWISKYARPIEFVAAENKPPHKKKKQKTSDGDQIASLYHNIISTNTTQKPTPLEQTTYCPDCDLDILTSDYQRHLAGTAHMVSKPTTVETPDLLELNGKNIGFKMMVSQGWKYEGGLGPQQEGKRHPIATTLKQDRLGIGHQDTAKKAITHRYREIEKKAIERQRRAREQQKNPGKEIALQAKRESQQRTALLHYLNS